jgi:hypothetical protein
MNWNLSNNINIDSMQDLHNSQKRTEEQLDRIESLLSEIKSLIIQNKGNTNSTTKITVIGNRPQKTTKIKGIDSDADCVL